MSDICYTPASVLANDLRSKRISAREVMAAHLDRIERINPQVNAIVNLRDRDELMAEAAAADDELVNGSPRGPLHGMPMAVKDLADVRGLPTRAGSPTTSAAPSEYDTLFVKRLRRAGVIFIGKTNTPEYGAGSQTFNSVFGTTLNPFNRERTPGGSSGGATSALAAGLVPLADGSDLGGSLRNPAAWCGVVGLRPSIGRVPSVPTDSGWINSLAVSGPLARNVDDIALLLSVMAGPDPRDPLSLPEAGSTFRAQLPGVLDGIRVGWVDGFGYPMEEEALRVSRGALERFDAAGAHVSHDAPDLSGAMEAFQIFRGLIFRPVRSLAAPDQYEQFKETLRWNIEFGENLTVDDVMRAEAIRTRIHLAMSEWFRTHDVLALPTTQVTAFPVEVEYPTEVDGVPLESYIDWMTSCCVISVTGCPAISMPVGFDSNGCPMGIQLVGPVGSEAKLLDIAKGFESATGDLRRRPTILPA